MGPRIVDRGVNHSKKSSYIFSKIPLKIPKISKKSQKSQKNSLEKTQKSQKKSQKSRKNPKNLLKSQKILKIPTKSQKSFVQVICPSKLMWRGATKTKRTQKLKIKSLFLGTPPWMLKFPWSNLNSAPLKILFLPLLANLSGGCIPIAPPATTLLEIGPLNKVNLFVKNPVYKNIWRTCPAWKFWKNLKYILVFSINL